MLPHRKVVRQRAGLAAQALRRAVPGGVEPGSGLPPLRVAMQDVVQHGIDAGRADILIGREVPGRVEVEIRRAPLLPSGVDEVLRRVHSGMPYIGMRRGVPWRVEDTAGLQRRQVAGARGGSLRGHVSSRASKDSR